MVSQAIPQLEWAIDNVASMIDAIFCDGDIASEPEAIKLVNKKSLELDNKIEEAIINSSLSPSKRSIGGKLLSLSYSKIGSLSHNNSYVEKRKAYETYEIERDPSTISKLEETIKSLRNSLNSFFFNRITYTR